MASVDGSKSIIASSDEVIQHTCGPCNDDGETKDAKYLCDFCKVYLCFDCRNDHKRFKATKNHSIVSAHSTQGTDSKTKSTFRILCGCDQKRSVEVYCEKHDEVICPTCKTIKHRNCKTQPIKDKIDKHTKKQLKDLNDRAKPLKVEIESCKQNGEANRKKLDSYKEECKKEITAFRKDINTILDKMEKDILERLDKTANQNLQAIEKQIADIKTLLQALTSDLDIIDNANKTNDDEIMFSANVKISKSISEYDDLIRDIRNGMKLPKLKFQKNKTLIDMLKCVEGLGRLEAPEVSSLQQDHVVILDMKVKSTTEVNMTLLNDKTCPYIAGCTFLPDNQGLLVCDYNNKKVKLLDSDMFVKKSLEFEDPPYNVAVAGDNGAIITFDNKRNIDLQFIYTHPDLKLANKITLPDKVYGLHGVNDEIYTAFHKASGHDEIWRLDLAGNFMGKNVLTQSSSGVSMFLGLCLPGPSSRVYLSDWEYNRVTCFQLDGKIVYQYEDMELKSPNGIYVDSVGNSFVCGTDSHNVFAISADGRKHGELLTPKDLKQPKCIDYRPTDNTLIVGCFNNSKLFVYKLGK